MHGCAVARVAHVDGRAYDDAAAAAAQQVCAVADMRVRPVCLCPPPPLCVCRRQATLRCFPFDQPPGPHTCFMTGQPAKEVALFAKSY